MKEEDGETQIAGQAEQGLEQLRAAAVMEPVEEMGPLRQENKRLREMIRMRDARDEITGALRTAGARSPGLLFAEAAGDLQFDAEGRVANREALVEKMRRAFPEQFGRDIVQPIDAGAGGASQVKYLTKEILAKMKPAEIAKLDWAEVRQVLSGER